MSHSTVHIRAARAGDSPGIARLQVDSYRTAYAGMMPKWYLAHFTYEEQELDWRDLIAAPVDQVLYVAVSGASEIVGYVLGGEEQSGETPYRSELIALHVRRTQQGRGIGRRLVTALADHLRRAGYPSLMLWVLAENPARGFYERLGGQAAGRRRITLGDPGVEEFSTTEVAYGWPDIGSLAALGEATPSADPRE